MRSIKKNSQNQNIGLSQILVTYSPMPHFRDLDQVDPFSISKPITDSRYTHPKNQGFAFRTPSTSRNGDGLLFIVAGDIVHKDSGGP